MLRTLLLWKSDRRCGLSGASEEGRGGQGAQAKPDLVKQANAPISSIMQIRFQDTYLASSSMICMEGATQLP